MTLQAVSTQSNPANTMENQTLFIAYWATTEGRSELKTYVLVFER